MLSSYTFPDAVAPHNASFLNDIVVDGVNGFAYISEAGTGAIVKFPASFFDSISNSLFRFFEEAE
jgi:hypothetical protein